MVKNRSRPQIFGAFDCIGSDTSRGTSGGNKTSRSSLDDETSFLPLPSAWRLFTVHGEFQEDEIGQQDN